MNQMNLPHGTLTLPAFFPDGTQGSVRCVDSVDLINCNIPGIVMNTYHLMTKPGSSVLKSLGGLHTFSNWDRFILTDSGGFQVFSLIRENASFGTITDNQIIFRNRQDGKKTIITPEKCIRSQFSYGSDIMMCLDYCTHPNDPYETNRRSVDITIEWAKRCKKEYLNLLAGSKKYKTSRPHLFGIIQGGDDKELRKECAEALIEIGFDGFGFGGWPLDKKGKLVTDILAYTAQLMPDATPKYAMGLGKPEEILECIDMGYNLFDCVIPTREARHNRLYTFHEKYGTIQDVDCTERDFYQYYYIMDDKHRRDDEPISRVCDCHCCRNYSRAYIRHLYHTGDSLGYRLATIHNLRFFTQLIELKQASIHS